MTDLAIIGLIVVYVVLGYWTGLIRRLVGFVAVYAALFAATAAGPTAATVVLQVFPNWNVPDALILGYFVFLAFIIVLIEVLATLYHGSIQLAVVVVDKGTGAIVGAVTALLGGTVALSLLVGATQPVQTSPDGSQIQIHDAINKSVLGPVLLGSLGKISKLVFLPVIPNDPPTYFNAQEARVQH